MPFFVRCLMNWSSSATPPPSPSDQMSSQMERMSIFLSSRSMSLRYLQGPDPVPEISDSLDLDRHDVAVLEKHGRLAIDADPRGRARRDDVSRHAASSPRRRTR